MISGLSVLAVVPARGGSKGIPRKNLVEVAGRSLVARAADTLRDCAAIDMAVISTDDPDIRDEALRAGLAAPFMRPAELASDTARSVDMWRHAWLASEEHAGARFDLSVLIEPTSPLRAPEDIEATLSAMVAQGSAAAATVSRLPAHYAPQKTLTLSPAGRVGFYLADGAAYTQRQSMPGYVIRNGACYAVRRATLVERGHILEEDCIGVLITRELVNIDDPFDFELAEFLLERRARRLATHA